MRPKSLILLCLALGCGLVASIGISQVMDRNKQPGADMQEIVVVTADIKGFDPLTKDNVKLEAWPREKVPANAITNLAEIEAARAKSAIYAGEVVITNKILKKGEYLDVDLPKGYRSIAVAVNDESAAGQLLRPGSRTDVLVFVNKAQNPDVRQTGTFTILKDIQIFAIDQTVRKATDKVDESVKAKTISLVVTPEQAQIVMTADQIGKLRFILRNQNEADDLTTDKGRLYSLDDILKSRKDGRSPDEAEAPPQQAVAAPAATGPSIGQSLLSWLDEQKNRSAGTNSQHSTVASKVESFTMQVLSGPEEKKVEFSRHGNANGWKAGSPATVPPIEPVSGEPALNLPSAATPAAGGGLDLDKLRAAASKL